MRSLWIDSGNKPDMAKVVTYGIKRVYFDPRDPQVTDVFLSSYRAKGLEVGVFRVSSWDDTPTPSGYAAACSNDITKLGANSKQLAVLMDVELHSQQWMVEMLSAYRLLRPTRVTDWTMEGFQGGWLSGIKNQIVAANVGLVPQTYTGSMVPQAADRVVLDLILNEMPANRISCFYDGARLADRWDGFVFTQGRLP